MWKIAPNDISRPARRRRRRQLNLTIYQELILAQIKHQSKQAQCQLLVLNQSKQFFIICPPALYFSFLLLLSFSLQRAGCFFAQPNEIKSSLIKIPVDIFTPRDYALLLFFSAHIHTHKRGEQETGCVFFAHNRHTPCSHLHAERTWQLSQRGEWIILTTQNTACGITPPLSKLHTPFPFGCTPAHMLQKRRPDSANFCTRRNRI